MEGNERVTEKEKGRRWEMEKETDRDRETKRHREILECRTLGSLAGVQNPYL